MKIVNYYGMKLEVPDDVTVIAMDGKRMSYTIVGYINVTSEEITWDKSEKMWVGGAYRILKTNNRVNIKPSKSKVAV